MIKDITTTYSAKTYLSPVRKILLYVLLFIVHGRISAQTFNKEETATLNNYVEFLNASVHGLSIAQVIFVNYNKVINKYVDINSHELTQISNKDLPLNIFGGSDAFLNFYDQSNTPESLAELAMKQGRTLDARLVSTLNFHTENIVQILKEINQIRFDVENFIQVHDLNDRTAIYGVYEFLERATDLFNDYANAHHTMAALLDVNGRKSNLEIIKSMSSLHRTTKIILSSLRRNEGKNAERNNRQLMSQLNGFKNVVNKSSFQGNSDEYTIDIENKVNSINQKLSQFVETGFVPIEEELYGKFYHYHNYILRYFNWYGPGFVRSMNELIRTQNLNIIYYDEEPIIYKVLYPMKIDEIENLSESENREISRADLSFESRPLNFSETPILAEGPYLEIEIYDHQMMDKDTISLKFNDEWILENYALKFEPKKITLKIDEDQDNLLVLHANNLGIIPPNTVAISYRYKGERKRVFLKSNLNQSEAVEIQLEGKIK